MGLNITLLVDEGRMAGRFMRPTMGALPPDPRSIYQAKMGVVGMERYWSGLDLGLAEGLR